ncbi:MAG: helix-turn-helix domain-containing protein, partial [Spirochaetales bacterium]|nr:helix-turn-helix domain-containing protein [Spirochaetales bacterium]
ERERKAITEALHRWEGNRTKAAKELGISRRTIIYKIQEYELDI